MDNINDLLSSISAEDMEKLKSVAASLMNSNNSNNQSPNSEHQSKPSNNSRGNDTTDLIMKVASAMNTDNERTAFIKALRPLLSEERRQKADEAMKFLKLMDTLPLLKGMF